MRNGLVWGMLALTFNAFADEFSYTDVGQLVPANSGQGTADQTVYAPGIRFPLKTAPAYANSQVYGVGGSQGPKGSQCDPANFRYPWHDNFCEDRPGRQTPACPTHEGHQGQDIRTDTCVPDMREAVATEEGRIIKIGPYWVGLLGKSGVYYSYLHMNPNRLFVKLDDQVSAGQTLGLVSDYMPGPHGTTTHLHFEIHIPVASADGGATFDIVEPYMSLVRSYQRLISSQ